MRTSGNADRLQWLATPRVELPSDEWQADHDQWCKEDNMTHHTPVASALGGSLLLMTMPPATWAIDAMMTKPASARPSRDFIRRNMMLAAASIAPLNPQLRVP